MKIIPLKKIHQSQVKYFFRTIQIHNIHTHIGNVQHNENYHIILPFSEDVEEEPTKGIFTYPKGESVLAQIWWCYTLPLRTLLAITIPSPVTCRSFYPFAFFMCIVWIGISSYVVSWSMTVIGKFNLFNTSNIVNFFKFISQLT